MNEKKEQQLRTELVDLSKRLVEEGLVIRTWGNFSVRLDEETFLITPSGRAYETMMPSDIVKVSIGSGKALAEEKEKPSSESPMHALVYQKREDVQVILHTHQVYASALSLSPRPWAVKGQRSEVFGTVSIPIAKYALPGTSSLHKNIKNTLDETDSDVILMARHGALIMGESIDEALNKALMLEEYSKETYEFITRRKIKDRTDLMDDSVDEIALRDKYQVLHPSTTVIISADLELHAYKGEILRAYLDDFAQICGEKIEGRRKRNNASLIPGNAFALCYAPDEKEARNVRAVLEKNVRAAHIAGAFSQAPISSWESRLMRFVYKKKYSSYALEKSEE